MIQCKPELSNVMKIYRFIQDEVQLVTVEIAGLSNREGWDLHE